jgi:hypothetical protein
LLSATIVRALAQLVITGAVVSNTVTVKLFVVELPEVSVAT